MNSTATLERPAAKPAPVDNTVTAGVPLRDAKATVAASRPVTSAWQWVAPMTCDITPSWVGGSLFRHGSVIEIQSGNGIIAFRNGRFLFQGNDFARLVKFHHTVSAGIFHVITEYASSFLHTGSTAEHGGKSLAVEHIIAQNQTSRFTVQEIGSQYESLCQTVGLLLHLIREGHSQFFTCSQQIAEHRQVTWSRDNQYFAYSRQHQCRQRIINHRLVVHRHDLFRNRLR